MAQTADPSSPRPWAAPGHPSGARGSREITEEGTAQPPPLALTVARIVSTAARRRAPGYGRWFCGSLSHLKPTPKTPKTQTKQNSVDDGMGRKMAAELVGSALFQIVGGCAAPGLAPVANGIGLAVLAYGVAGISGAHLNPAISIMLWVRQKCSLSTALLYSFAQIAGATLGAAICSLIVPGVTLGMGMGAPGTFAPAAGLAAGAVFAWECAMTFMLGAVVYATAVAKPGFGNVAPLAIGLTVTAAASSAGPFTGAILNPARAIGPAIAFGLPAATVGVYVAAQLTGALLAAVWAASVHGQ